MDAAERRARFGKALRAARLASGLSQARLSARIEKDQGMVSDYEAGKTEPGVETVAALEQALDVEPGSLSRYLGWVPADPDDAPEPPDVPPIRGALPPAVFLSVSEFGKSLGDFRIETRGLAAAVEAVKGVLGNIDMAKLAKEIGKSFDVKIPVEAICRIGNLDVVPVPATLLGIADAVAVGNDGNVTLIETKTVRTPTIPSTTKVHAPSVSVEDRVEKLEVTLDEILRKLDEQHN